MYSYMHLLFLQDSIFHNGKLMVPINILKRRHFILVVRYNFNSTCAKLSFIKKFVDFSRTEVIALDPMTIPHHQSQINMILMTIRYTNACDNMYVFD